MKDYRQPANAPRDLTGQTFGSLKVLRQGEQGLGRQRWVVQCACGSPEQSVTRSTLLRGAKLSCGCHRRERMRQVNASHRMSATPTYVSWRAMVQRCEDPAAAGWSNYGGRGITVCPRWRESFDAFFVDMGERPSKEHSLDRVNNQRGYDCGRCDDCLGRSAPFNCRWATRSEQGRNRQTNVVLEFDGFRGCVADWAERLGLPAGVLHQRIAKGWPTERVIREPYRSRRGAS